MIQIDPVYVAFITGPLFVPFFSALLAKAGISVKIKVAIVAVVSAVVAAVASFVVPDTGVAVISWQALGQFAITFLTAKTGYDSFWKPVLSINDQKLMLPSKGIGTVMTPEN